MSGILGDFLVIAGSGEVLGAEALRNPASWPPLKHPAAINHWTVGDRLQVWARGDTRVFAEQGLAGGLGLALEPLRGHSRADAADPRDAAMRAWREQGQIDLRTFFGRYAYVLWDAEGQRLRACTDTFRTCPIYYAAIPGGLLLASDLRLILRSGLIKPRVSRQAIYQYLNFSYIPAPLTPVEGVHKLPSGHWLDWQNGALHLAPHWDARYPEDNTAAESERVRELRQTIEQTVTDYLCGDATGWGTFLSGGNDSSTVSGLLSKASAAPVNSFSIGFAEEGYDELPYARIASDYFGLQAHEYRVSEDDTMRAIDDLVRAYDEPFGNSSAIPTFYCTDLAARNEVSLMIAGDGGDEIYGGNERYKKDQIFTLFHRSPAPLRAVARGVARFLGPIDSRWANKIKNFVERGSLPNPDRFYSDDAFASKYFSELLSPDFQSAVGIDDALDVQRKIFHQAQATAELNRLLYLDLKLTIAENDLVKVTRAAKVCGVQVMFPFIDSRLIECTGRLPAADKVRGLKKRYLFKLATNDLLPEGIKKKKKHGFGLPTSVWLRRGGAYADRMTGIVLSERALARGYFNRDFIATLVDRHRRGAWDHAADIHQLAMLELWHREYLDSLVST